MLAPCQPLIAQPALISRLIRVSQLSLEHRLKLVVGADEFRAAAFPVGVQGVTVPIVTGLCIPPQALSGRTHFQFRRRIDNQIKSNQIKSKAKQNKATR